MTNPIAKAVHCPTCGAPPRRACHALNPAKQRVVPSHSARRKLYAALAKQKAAWTVEVENSGGWMEVHSCKTKDEADLAVQYLRSRIGCAGRKFRISQRETKP